MNVEAERKRIGERIAELRKAKRMTQADIEFLTGIKRVHVSRVETGKYNVGFDTLQKIAHALGMKVDIV